MQDQSAARGARPRVPSVRIAMLLAAVLWSLGATDRIAFAQDAPGAAPASPLTEPAPRVEPPSAGTPAAPSGPTPPAASTTQAAPPAAADPTPAPSETPAASPKQAAPVPTIEATTEPPPSVPVTTASDEEAEDIAPSSAGEQDEDAPLLDATAEAAQPESLPHDLSPWGMYEAADIVVKAVMIGLVFACFITWTVWLAKTIELAIAKTKLRSAIQRISSAESLTHAVQVFAGVRGAGSRLVHEAAEEVSRSARLLDHAGDQGVKERVTSRLSRIEAGAQRRMTLGTGVLATIGSTAPFVGLFGTVWGIMNSFIGIAQSQTTNLAVVAPGIAEALLATGIGLIAAIPAVIIYNAFARSIAGYKLLLADAAAGVERLVSHELDLRKLWQASKPAKQAAAAE